MCGGRSVKGERGLKEGVLRGGGVCREGNGDNIP